MGQLIMATELTVQSERAFQKQPHIFTNPKAKVTKRSKRWVKDVGLGFKTPKTAIEANYIDKKCPFTGTVSIRGKILTGTVVSTKMHRTIIIRREYLHYVPKYNDTRRDTRTWLLTFLQLSVSKREMLSLLDNVDQLPRPLDSMCWRLLLRFRSPSNSPSFNRCN